ncbi:hypothetical protein [Microvirga puerhi]|uniref:Uncharacterized protein n=1 Tax=Microvirga puerhi TaxID=2876078 RepID=A0ABS7VPB6_9HYPH|nr:hypothetical protein [Microvirga puerhi]MBZ6076793.1 hypothetical protein [Microvirga puerhi]
MTYGPDVPAPGQTDKFATDEIILYGVKLNSVDSYARLDLTWRSDFLPPQETVVLQLQMLHRKGNGSFADFKNSEVVIAAIYGYAFEGHCFRPDKIRIYAFYYNGPDLGAVGCGFDESTPLSSNSYRMWRLKMRAPLMEISATLDTAEALILDASLPGKRAPNTYDSRMQMSHRGGRLTSS